MQSKLTTEIKWNWPDQSVDVLPMITALFKEGIQPDFDWLKDPHTKQKTVRLAVPSNSVFSLPSFATGQTVSNRQCSPPTGSAGLTEQRGLACPNQKSQHRIIRNFIRGISHHFNNLLMGIWGNASLIRMGARAGDRLYDQMVQLERLIQSGSFLIHVILGYLGERRKAARNIRLRQLVKEVQGLTRSGDAVIDRLGLDALMQWVSQVNQPTLIACSTARVLERFLNEIEAYRSGILKADPEHESLNDRLSTIGTLVAKGLTITRQLRLYAGDVKPRKRRVSIEKIVRNQVRRMHRQQKHLNVSCDVNTSRTHIWAERQQIDFVLHQLVDNAVRAMPDGGKLKISLTSLCAETTENRCVQHSGGDYVVITVKDTGQGIAKHMQARIFEPFFSTAGKPNAVGLGLSAARGIVKFYGGHMHVQSVRGAGCVFKIYWPLRSGKIQRPACMSQSLALAS